MESHQDMATKGEIEEMCELMEEKMELSDYDDDEEEMGDSVKSGRTVEQGLLIIYNMMKNVSHMKPKGGVGSTENSNNG